MLSELSNENLIIRPVQHEVKITDIICLSLPVFLRDLAFLFSPLFFSLSVR